MEAVILLTEFRLNFNMDKANALTVIGRISPRPVFFIHGDKDDEVLPRDSKALYEKTAQPKEIWLARGASHVGTFAKYPAEYKKKVLTFFNKYLKSSLP